MNSITVTAHGAPNSLARRAQHNPQIAVELYLTLIEAKMFIDAQVGVPRVQLQQSIERTIAYADGKAVQS